MKKTILAFACMFCYCGAAMSAVAQPREGDYKEIVLSIPGIDSEKTYQAIKSLFEGTTGLEIMLRCKRGEMLVLKVDTRLYPNPDILLRRISDHNFKAILREGFDYNKAVATCSDFKPE